MEGGDLPLERALELFEKGNEAERDLPQNDLKRLRHASKFIDQRG